jgi:hypothetical protein
MVVPKNNGKLRICVNFRKLNVAMKKDPYLLPFTNEVLDTVIGHDAYSFLNGYFGYHHISITPNDRYKITFVTNWGAFIWVVITSRNHVVYNQSLCNSLSFATTNLVLYNFWAIWLCVQLTCN